MSVHPMTDPSLPCQDEAQEINIEQLRERLEDEYRTVCELTFRFVFSFFILNLRGS